MVRMLRGSSNIALKVFAETLEGTTIVDGFIKLLVLDMGLDPFSFIICCI